MSESDKNRGLYDKFHVLRNDGESFPGGRHHNCQYFVLDIDHDPFAKAALRAYAAACGVIYPELAQDLYKMADRPLRAKDDVTGLRWGAQCPHGQYRDDGCEICLRNGINAWTE